MNTKEIKEQSQHIVKALKKALPKDQHKLANEASKLLVDLRRRLAQWEQPHQTPKAEQMIAHANRIMAEAKTQWQPIIDKHKQELARAEQKFKSAEKDCEEMTLRAANVVSAALQRYSELMSCCHASIRVMTKLLEKAEVPQDTILWLSQQSEADCEFIHPSVFAEKGLSEKSAALACSFAFLCEHVTYNNCFKADIVGDAIAAADDDEYQPPVIPERRAFANALQMLEEACD